MNERYDPFKTTPPQTVEENISPVAVTSDQPQQIGRYRVEKILGEGGFGRVYLAHDDDLHRPVAIKVPHKERVSSPQDAETYLTEARVVASLDHPNIVPVHDVGRTDDGLCFVVSKFIEGHDLAQIIKETRLSCGEAAEVIGTVAEALHYAHRKGLVHRDIKPGNILIDANGKAFVADFGMALREEDFGKGVTFAGTPAYMSPEQARREGHRVDGRSDIFSLGVVFYELLTGRRPFPGQTLSEILQQVMTVEARPPRQVDDTIPKELERICLKAISKRASERYTTARDMADDLRHFLSHFPVIPVSRALPSDTPTVVGPAIPAPDQRPLKIVPKGLRSFDAGDADFFLELLPGPRDRDGMPESIRFWKTRIEEKEPEQPFSVGLIYGPSGCGKSSLVKAGLLPRLDSDVIPVYVEATAQETETRLLKGLRKRFPALPADLGLKETLAALRRGHGLLSGKKVLIVLDQFEQWLHAKRREENTELVQAVRHCDGERVQCIVMVRDDFWLAVSRFMQALEIRVLEGENSRLVDLFDTRHARKVLTAFGRAFGALPDSLSKDQDAFLDQAVPGLAQDGKIICVRLALFAEMMKGKPWTPATLKEVGGTEGLGVTFLDETFSATTAPPEHRYHQKAARAVLKFLLPESGTDIKGHMRSQQELLEVSSYASRPKDFDGMIRILDGEIRLITPTDPEGKEGAEESTSQAQPGQKYYQLTHDYLVPSLRDWLTRKQRETRRGRAELRLAERAAMWNARPEQRQMPSGLEWLQIRLFTQKQNWTPLEKRMMKACGIPMSLFITGAVVTIALLWGYVSLVMAPHAREEVAVMVAAHGISPGTLLVDQKSSFKEKMLPKREVPQNYLSPDPAVFPLLWEQEFLIRRTIREGEILTFDDVRRKTTEEQYSDLADKVRHLSNQHAISKEERERLLYVLTQNEDSWNRATNAEANAEWWAFIGVLVAGIGLMTILGVVLLPFDRGKHGVRWPDFLLLFVGVALVVLFWKLRGPSLLALSLLLVAVVLTPLFSYLRRR